MLNFSIDERSNALKRLPQPPTLLQSKRLRQQIEEEKLPISNEGPIPHAVQHPPVLLDDSETYFGVSNTLQTTAHRKMVMKFVRDLYPQARFQRIYDARTNGRKADDWHRCCGHAEWWTLNIIKTTEGFIFGGFTTADWVPKKAPKGK